MTDKDEDAEATDFTSSLGAAVYEMFPLHNLDPISTEHGEAHFFLWILMSSEAMTFRLHQYDKSSPKSWIENWNHEETVISLISESIRSKKFWRFTANNIAPGEDYM